MTADRLNISGVGKRRGATTVLDDISLSVAPGERMALLGHNGAGKTTLIKLVLGLIKPDAGEISVFGERPGGAAARRATAYLPESVSFHPALTGREQLLFFTRLVGGRAAEVDVLLDRVGLTSAGDKPIRTWSKGMRQRLGMAQALLGTPQIVLLDEPTSGLDPVSRHDLYAIIDEMAARGAAVLIASHALTEVEARTDRIVIMRSGRLIADDTLAGLSAGAGLPIRLRLTAAPDQADAVQRQLGGERMNGATVDISCEPEAKMARLAEIAALGALVTDIEMTPPGLEDLYRHYTGEATP